MTSSCATAAAAATHTSTSAPVSSTTPFAVISAT